MSARKFVRACKEERDALLAIYADPASDSWALRGVGEAELTAEQRRAVIGALDQVLTDTFYTLLLGLAGAASLGGCQQRYRLEDEDGRPISHNGDDDLESLAFEYFQNGT